MDEINAAIQAFNDLEEEFEFVITGDGEQLFEDE